MAWSVWENADGRKHRDFNLKLNSEAIGQKGVPMKENGTCDLDMAVWLKVAALRKEFIEKILIAKFENMRRDFVRARFICLRFGEYLVRKEYVRERKKMNNGCAVWAST